MGRCAGVDRKNQRPSYDLTIGAILDVVANSEKKRYVLNEDCSKIKAAQGHSIEVDLNLKKEVPPFILYHGTVEKFLPFIKKDGLSKMSRNHVHLSKDEATANVVGNRRGKAIILRINARQMHNEGHAFYLAENDVWLTDAVPTKYILFP